MPSHSCRIIHILSGDLWAGAEVMAFNLLKGLISTENYIIKAIVLNKGQVAFKLRKEGIQVVVLDESQSSFPNLVAKVRGIIRDFKPHIVHAHRYKENILAFSASLGIKGIKLVATQHGMPETQTKGTTFKSILIQRLNSFILNRFFDNLVAVSWEMKDSLVKKGFRSKKVSVIHNGIELPQCLQKVGTKNSFVVGSCGRLFPVKNYELFIETAAQLPEIQFVLAGDGPEMEKLRLQCTRADLDDNFTFLGQIQDMQSFYSNLDLYMSTSIHEGIPMSVLEAMGHGLPVIAPKVGGFPEIIDDGVDGLLIPRHKPELFAKACLQLYSEPALLAKASRAARVKVESKFSVQHMTTDYINLYQNLTA